MYLKRVFFLAYERIIPRRRYIYVPTIKNFRNVNTGATAPAAVQCPAGQNGVYPHPFDCTKYLNCDNGRTHIQDCAPGTAWSSAMEVCDFVDKVDCSGRNGINTATLSSSSSSSSTSSNSNSTTNTQVDYEYSKLAGLKIFFSKIFIIKILINYFLTLQIMEIVMVSHMAMLVHV